MAVKNTTDRLNWMGVALLWHWTKDLHCWRVDSDSVWCDCCRTARGDSCGTALSFVTVMQVPLLEAVKQTLLSGCVHTSILIRVAHW